MGAKKLSGDGAWPFIFHEFIKKNVFWIAIVWRNEMHSSILKDFLNCPKCCTITRGLSNRDKPEPKSSFMSSRKEKGAMNLNDSLRIFT
ncbi:MAG: hypothetical protein DSY55_03350 [Clostridia bacterium]|nr:MAG: hypothetical protein DSY55_03350 [Clostridia bacterium]